MDLLTLSKTLEEVKREQENGIVEKSYKSC